MEPPSSLIIILGILLILLLVCSALISGSEVAFFSLTPKQVDNIKISEDKKSKKVLRLLSNPDYLLGTILQVNNLVNILIVLISTTLLSYFFDFSNNPVMEFLVNTVIVTFVLVLFGEVLPKIVATHYQVKFSRFMSGPITFLSPITKPFNFFMNKFTSKVSHNISLRGEVTLEDLSEAVDIATEGAIEEKKMLKGIVKLPITNVEKIMKPRVDVVAIDVHSTNDEVLKIAAECGFSRLPVYQEDLDNIKGFLYIKDMLPYVVNKDAAFNWKKCIREAYYVPQSKKINDLLEEFRTKRMHLAVVVDEYGGTDGIVTLEDILEEIVGEIVDESDFEELNVLNKKINLA